MGRASAGGTVSRDGTQARAIALPDSGPASRRARAGWYARAACRGMDPQVFFDCMSPVSRARAKEICSACPVREACLEAAMAEEAALGGTPTQNFKFRVGIRGGLGATERWEMAYPEARRKRKSEPSRTRKRRPQPEEEIAA